MANATYSFRWKASRYKKSRYSWNALRTTTKHIYRTGKEKKLFGSVLHIHCAMYIWTTQIHANFTLHVCILTHKTKKSFHHTANTSHVYQVSIQHLMLSSVVINNEWFLKKCQRLKIYNLIFSLIFSINKRPAKFRFELELYVSYSRISDCFRIKRFLCAWSRHYYQRKARRWAFQTFMIIAPPYGMRRRSRQKSRNTEFPAHLSLPTLAYSLISKYNVIL